MGISSTVDEHRNQSAQPDKTYCQRVSRDSVIIGDWDCQLIPQEQQVAEELVSKDDHVNAIVALSEASTRGAYYALVEFNRIGEIKLIGFDQDLLEPVRSGGIDSIILQNTYEMGRRAMGIMDGSCAGSFPRSRSHWSLCC